MNRIMAVFAACSLFLSLAHAQTSPGYNSRSFQYLTGVLTTGSRTTDPVANAFNSANPPKWYTLSVTTAAAGAFSVILEGSLDNTNWSTIAVTTSVIGMASNTAPIPALYLRARANTIAAGLSVTATAIGTW